MKLTFLLLVFGATLARATTVTVAPHSMERIGCNPGETFSQYAERLGWSPDDEWSFLDQTYGDCRDPSNNCGSLLEPTDRRRRESVGAHHLNFMLACIKSHPAGRVRFAVPRARVGNQEFSLTCKGEPNLRALFAITGQDPNSAAVTARFNAARGVRGPDTVGPDGREVESEFMMWSDLSHNPDQCWLGRALTLWKRQCYPVDYRSADSDHRVSCPNDFDGSTDQLCKNYRPGVLARAVGTEERSRLCLARRGTVYQRPVGPAASSSGAQSDRSQPSRKSSGITHPPLEEKTNSKAESAR